MSAPFLLRGLNPQQSNSTVWNLLFSPSLRRRLGTEWSRTWCEELIDHFAGGDHAAFAQQYRDLALRVRRERDSEPELSMENPPWAMMSLDMKIGMIPWVSPLFERSLLTLAREGAALEKHFGEVVPIAFICSGGPGESPDSAFRICAPCAAVRVSAEHWLMRALLHRRSQGLHATLRHENSGRQFSSHGYIDSEGEEKQVFFETTKSFGREKEDFDEFLQSNGGSLSAR
jgi:hypothetical protein